MIYQEISCTWTSSMWNDDGIVIKLNLKIDLDK